MGSMSIMHWMIVIAVVVLLFGRGKISGLMGDLADGIKSFKKGMQEEDAPVGVAPPLETHDGREGLPPDAPVSETTNAKIGI
jgi:sec-independent protein translocase protein TatA